MRDLTILKKGSMAALVVLILAVSGCSSMTADTAPAADQRTITVQGEGTAYGAPDQVSVQIGVETYGETVVEATNDNEDIMQALFEVLMEEGIDREDIQTSNFSVWGESQYMDGGFQEIAGYRVNNQLNITVRNLDTLSSVLQSSMDAGANSIYGVNFGISDRQDLKSEARQLAVQNASEIAEELAGLSGLELGSVLEISETTGYSGMADFGRPQSGGAGDAPAPSIAPGKVSAYIQVQVTYAVE